LNKSEYLKILTITSNEYDSYLYRIKNIFDDDFTLKEFSYKKKNKFILAKCLYENKTQTKDIFGELFYSKLETLHSSWFDEFTKIYNICTKNSGGIISSMFKKNKVSDFDKEKIIAYHDDLLQTTKELKSIINKITSRLKALPDSKFL